MTSKLSKDSMKSRSQGWYFQIVAQIIIKKDDKFLLVKRSKNETIPRIWEFPAGKVELLENIEDAAVREMKEESGLTPSKINYIGYHERHGKERKQHKVYHNFLVEDFEGEVELSEEHDDYRWMTKEEVLNFDNVGIDTIEIIKRGFS